VSSSVEWLESTTTGVVASILGGICMFGWLYCWVSKISLSRYKRCSRWRWRHETWQTCIHGRCTSSSKFWSTSVCAAWFHSTFRSIASRRQQSPAGVIDPLTPADWLFHAREQTTAIAASPSKDLECGTVFLLNFVHQISRWRRSETDLRHSCSICNCYPAHLQLLRDLALYKCSIIKKPGHR